MILVFIVYLTDIKNCVNDNTTRAISNNGAIRKIIQAFNVFWLISKIFGINNHKLVSQTWYINIDGAIF